MIKQAETSLLDFFKNSDLSNQLNSSLIADGKWMIPLGAALVGGAATGGISSFTKPINESASSRRKRILKSALLGTLGAGAGTAAIMAALGTAKQSLNVNPENKEEIRKAIAQKEDELNLAKNRQKGLTSVAPIAGGLGGAVVGKGLSRVGGKLGDAVLETSKTNIKNKGGTPLNLTDIPKLRKNPNYDIMQNFADLVNKRPKDYSGLRFNQIPGKASLLADPNDVEKTIAYLKEYYKSSKRVGDVVGTTMNPDAYKSVIMRNLGKPVPRNYSLFKSFFKNLADIFRGNASLGAKSFRLGAKGGAFAAPVAAGAYLGDLANKNIIRLGENYDEDIGKLTGQLDTLKELNK